MRGAQNLCQDTLASEGRRREVFRVFGRVQCAGAASGEEREPPAMRNIELATLALHLLSLR